MSNWVAIGFTVLITVLGWAYIWGKTMEALDSVRKDIIQHDKQHEDHYRHSSNSDRHWTSHERNELNEKLSEMRGDIKTLLIRSAAAGGKTNG